MLWDACYVDKEVLPLFLVAFALIASDFDDAVALIERGNPQAAIPLLERHTSQNAKDARAWKALGVAHASLNQYSEAEPAFAKACILAPALPDACYYHGRALYALNRFPESLASLAKATQSNWPVSLAIAQSHEANGDAAKAEKAFRQSVAACAGKAADPSAALGLFLIRQGRLSEAESVLSAAVQRFPNAANARTQLGRLLIEKNAASDAIPHLEAAVQYAPNSAQAHLLLAKAYTHTGRANEAKPHFEAAARLEASSQGATQ